MVTLRDIMDVDLLERHVKEGLVSARHHPTLPLTIFNYTPECQWQRAWDEVTTQTRGLIVDGTMQVISRPFPKFFNWDESSQPYPPAGPVLRMEKMDGSLGILFEYAGEFGVATRGSFESDQAKWATKFFAYTVIETWYDGMGFSPNSSKTYLFEIIYPENRIVVDYGDYEGLALIDVIDNETGFSDTDEFDNCAWPEKVTRLPFAGFDVSHIHDIPAGDEGFVYLWPTRNYRTKVKSADYVALHRLISNLNEKTIWQALVDGKTIDDIKKDLPEEFHGFVDEKGGEILDSAFQIVASVHKEFYEIIDRCDSYHKESCGVPFTVDRAEFAKMAVKSPNRAYLFTMLDRKAVYPVALRACKPKNVRTLED